MIAVRASSRSLSELLHAFDVPDSLRAEILGGLIVMSPLTRGRHALTVDLVRCQLQRACPPGHRPIGGIRYRCPATGDEPIPDLTVVPDQALDEDLRFHALDIVELVVEVGSESSIRNDREPKRLLYASQNIPLYLLVDPLLALVTLYTDPQHGDYLAHHTVAFGDPITIPAPFALRLETDQFPAKPHRPRRRLP